MPEGPKLGMGIKVTIVEPDEASRKQLQAAVTRENIQGIEINDKPGEGATLWLGKGPEKDSFPKPVRLGAVLDRVRRLQAGAKSTGKKIAIGPYELDSHGNELLTENDRSIRLTDKEKQILALLAEAQGKAVDRHVLLEKVWGYAPDLDTHTLETHIYRLRQKIEDDPGKPEILLTDGAGYKIPA
jgi:DNA-binding response OmpR family regulator